MTVLSACQSAGVRLLGQKPTSLFSAPSAFAMELAELATETATAIAKAHDWQVLTKLGTITGDGTATAFPMPADYDRMLKKASLHSKNWQNSNFFAARDLDQFLYYKDVMLAGTPGTWILLGGQMQIVPPISNTETARFYYITNQIVSGAKVAFTADTDTMILPERLLTLGVIWRWRSQKRMEYSEDMSNYEIALADEIGRDKGARPMVVGRQRLPVNSQFAFPGTLGP